MNQSLWDEDLPMLPGAVGGTATQTPPQAPTVRARSPYASETSPGTSGTISNETTAVFERIVFPPMSTSEPVVVNFDDYEPIGLVDEAQEPMIEAAAQPEEPLIVVPVIETPAIQTPAIEEPSDPYAGWLKERLYARARKLGIPGRSRMSKAQLKAALLAA